VCSSLRAVVRVRLEAGAQGLAGFVVRAAFQYCRDKGLRAIPTCSYVAGFVEKHPEWRDVVVTLRLLEPSAEAPGADGSADEGDDARVGRQEDHIFSLSYGQYAKAVYVPGKHAVESMPSSGVVSLSCSSTIARRMASLCVRRAGELDAREGAVVAERSSDSLRLEAAHLFTFLANAHPDMEWIDESTRGQVDDLETRGFLVGFNDARVARDWRQMEAESGAKRVKGDGQ
jgi:hypothetical protein